jgi:hypothetical protein
VKKLRLGCTVVSCAALLLWGSSVPVTAQGQQALVIEGGTLIDGNGDAPLANSVVVVEGNRIAAVGTAAAKILAKVRISPIFQWITVFLAPR